MSTVQYTVADHVATIALDRPEARNALSDELLEDLLEAFATARDDDDVRCVVLTSTHEKIFSAGGDLKGFALRRSAGASSTPGPTSSRACSR